MLQGRINTLGWIFAAFVALALIEYRFCIFAPLERRSTDLLTRIHAAHVAADPEIVIVDIDEKSLTRMSEIDRWPWPRSVHGELAAGLAQQKPKAIVFDILLGEPDRSRPELDELFNQLIAPLGNVYFATVRRDAQADPYGVLLRDMAQPLGMLYLRDAQLDARADMLVPVVIRKQNARLGVINALLDADGLLRRSYLYLPAYGWKIPSLPARVAADLGYRIPEGESILLNWSDPGHRHFSYSDLYEDFGREHRQRDPNEFHDKIVVVGASAIGLYDLRATPLSETYPGVEIIATALDNLKNQSWMRVAPPWLPLLVTLVIMAAICVAFSRGAHTLQIGVVTFGGLVVLLLISYAAMRQRLVLPMLTPVIFGVSLYFACALHEYLRERRERLRAVDYFSRFVNPHVVKDLLAHGGLSKDGESREITVLFSDIRGFTSLSETRKPTEVVSILNRYFGRQVEVIFRHGGCLDKFIGDAIMAMWGAPLDDPDHAKHAVMAALEMSEALEQFRKDLGELGRSFDVGIGIHSGPAVVGIIGSENKREYTAIGDTVNLASRIEGLTKGVARVLVSEDTMLACAGAFVFADRGSHKVKGREQAVRLYEPSGKINENQK